MSLQYGSNESHQYNTPRGRGKQPPQNGQNGQREQNILGQETPRSRGRGYGRGGGGDQYQGVVGQNPYGGVVHQQRGGGHQQRGGRQDRPSSHGGPHGSQCPYYHGGSQGNGGSYGQGGHGGSRPQSTGVSSEGSRHDVETSIKSLLNTMAQRKVRGQAVGPLGLKQLVKKFRLFDDGVEGKGVGDQKLNWEEFSTGIRAQQGFRPKSEQLNDSEIKDLFNHCDTDGSGFLDTDEFLHNIIKTALTPEIRKNLMCIFKDMDVDKSGYIGVKEMKRHYSMKMNPDVQNGKLTEDEAFAKYIESFEPDFLDGQANVSDSQISLEEWLDYNCGVFAQYRESHGSQAPCFFNTYLQQTYKNFGKACKENWKDSDLKTFNEYRAEQKGQGDAARKSKADAQHGRGKPCNNIF